MIRKAIVGLAAVLAAALAFSVGTGNHAATHHGPSAAQARTALVKYLRSYSPTMKWTSHLKPGAKRAGSLGVTKTGNLTKTGSYNWGGYATASSTAQAYTKVTGSWKVPKVTCSKEDRLTAIWVGLDGFTTSTVEQDGTLDWCFQGTAHYYSWYEMYPAASVDVGTSVAAGDRIIATVTRSGTSYSLKLTDSTHTKNSFSKTGSCALATCLDESAEWIVERPAFSSTGITPLAQIGSVTFTNSNDTAFGTNHVISKSANIYDIHIADSTNTYTLWKASGLNSAGNSFSGTWFNSY